MLRIEVVIGLLMNWINCFFKSFDIFLVVWIGSVWSSSVRGVFIVIKSGVSIFKSKCFVICVVKFIWVWVVSGLVIEDMVYKILSV